MAEKIKKCQKKGFLRKEVKLGHFGISSFFGPIVSFVKNEFFEEIRRNKEFEKKNFFWEGVTPEKKIFFPKKNKSLRIV